MITICFTGHRPNKLGGYDWNTVKNHNIMKELSCKIMDVLDNNEGDNFHFICGGALGIDQMAFHICDKLKLTYDNISIEVAIPFLKQDVKWNDLDRIKWRQQLNKADKITRVDKLENYKIKGYEEDIYYPAKMQKRNQYMVNSSDIVIAVWSGSKGGTGNCVNYAKMQKKEIIVINPDNI